MKSAADTVVSFHYDVADESGEVVEDSRKRETPMVVLLGYEQLLPGLETALMDRESGDHFDVNLEPEQAYGPHRDGQIQRVPKKYFRNGARLKVGMTTTLNLRDGGQQTVRVHKVGMSTIDVDVNHPLAGKALTFNVDVVDVREATPEEIAHRHAHAPGETHA